MQMESPVMSPAFLVLPHPLLHRPSMDLWVFCLPLLSPAKAPPPRCLHLLWWRWKPQHGTMKLSLKIKNDMFEPLALLKQINTLTLKGARPRCSLLPAKSFQSFGFMKSYSFCSVICWIPIGNASFVGPPMCKRLEKKHLQLCQVDSPWQGPRVFSLPLCNQLQLPLMETVTAGEVAGGSSSTWVPRAGS